MKFQFSMEKVLNHRVRLEELAQKDFQEALDRLNQEIDRLNKMDEAVTTAHGEAFRLQSEGGAAGPGLGQVYEFLKGQDVRRERQKEKIKECESLVESLREILRQRAVDVKIIEELKEKKREEFKLEQKKREQKITDDMNVMRFGRGDKLT